MEASSTDEEGDTPGSSSKMLIDFDAVLASVGGWGWFQRVLFHGLCIPVVFATTLMFTVTVFSAAVPKFRCRTLVCDVSDGNATFQDAFQKHFDTFTIPQDTGNAQCFQYRYVNQTSLSEDRCLASHFDNGTLEPCSQWIFDKTVFSTTFMAEAEIICDQSWKVPISQSIFFFGVLLAALSSGLLSDKFGRRHVIMGCILILSISSLGMIFARSYWLYVIMSFLIAIGQAGLFLVSFVLALEMVGPESRVYCGVIIEMYFVLGEILASGLAYWQRDWRNVIIITTVPVFLFLLYWPFLPESVRWLLSQRKYEEAQNATNRIARWNRCPSVNLKDFNTEDTSSSTVAPRESMIDLLKDPVLAWRLLNMCYTWIIVILGYYGLSLSSVSLSGDPYLNFFLVSLVEIPAYIMAWFGMEKFGRRKTMVISLGVGGVALLANGAVDLAGQSDGQFFKWFNMVAFLVGKFGLTSAFGTVYVYSSELFPTSMRTAGIGTCSTFGRLGAIVTPFISDQAKRKPWIAMFIFGGNAVVAAGLNLLFPETLGLPLPETLSQARSIGRSNPNRVVVVHGEEEPLLGSS